MAAKLTFNDLAMKVHQDDIGKIDFSVALNELHMKEDGRLVRINKLASSGLILSDHAFGQALGTFGMPIKYGRRLLEERPDLLANEFNHWAHKETDKKVLIRIRKGQQMIRGFLSDKYTILDNRNILEVITGLLNDNRVSIKIFYLDDNRLHIRIIFKETKIDIGNGKEDIFYSGIDILNSEVGLCSALCRVMLYRQICTNGAVAMIENAEYVHRHIGISTEALTVGFSNIIETGMEKGELAIKKLVATKQIVVSDPIHYIEKVSEDLYSKKFVEDVKGFYAQEPEENIFGIIAAFTRAARSLNDIGRVEVEKFASELMARKIA